MIRTTLLRALGCQFGRTVTLTEGISHAGFHVGLALAIGIRPGEGGCF
jgi:hypothetical protein